MSTATNGPVGPAAAAGGIPPFFDRRTLAAFLLVSTRTLDRLDAVGKLPPAVRIGAAKRWTRASIEEWVRLGCPGREEAATPRAGRQ